MKDVFIPAFNKQFGVAPSKERAMFTNCFPRMKEKTCREYIFNQNIRKVSNDFCIQYQNQWMQLEKEQPTLVCRKDTVVIEKKIENTLHMKLPRKIY